jgi:hypothetical protein
MGIAMRRRPGGRRGWALAAALIVALGAGPGITLAQDTAGLERYEAGRFVVTAAPHDETLARSLLREAVRRDSFPWLPRPGERLLIQVAPDRTAFEELIGPFAPEYGSAIAIPSERRIVMQGSRAGSAAGNPLQVLRHELAHLALAEFLGESPPRWFNEGYASFAAGEWGREEMLATNFSLLWRGVPSLEELERSFGGGAGQATGAYALAHRAVTELASLDRERGLTLFFRYWRDNGRMSTAIRRAFNMTEGEFEALWQQRTRRRYGALSLFADLTIAMTVLFVLLVPLYVSRRRRNRERLARMAAAEEKAEREERESAIEALLRSLAPPSGPDEA